MLLHLKEWRAIRWLNQRSGIITMLLIGIVDSSIMLQIIETQLRLNKTVKMKYLLSFRHSELFLAYFLLGWQCLSFSTDHKIQLNFWQAWICGVSLQLLLRASPNLKLPHTHTKEKWPLISQNSHGLHIMIGKHFNLWKSLMLWTLWSSLDIMSMFSHKHGKCGKLVLLMKYMERMILHKLCIIFRI